MTYCKHCGRAKQTHKGLCVDCSTDLAYQERELQQKTEKQADLVVRQLNGDPIKISENIIKRKFNLILH